MGGLLGGWGVGGGGWGGGGGGGAKGMLAPPLKLLGGLAPVGPPLKLLGGGSFIPYFSGYKTGLLSL